MASKYQFGYKKGDYDEAEVFVKNRMQRLNDYFEANIRARMREDIDYYMSKPVARKNENDANLFIPRTREVVEETVPRLSGELLNTKAPFVILAGRKPDDITRERKTESYLFSRFQNMGFPVGYSSFVRRGCICGFAVAKVEKDARTPHKRKRTNSYKKDDKCVFLPVDSFRYRIDPEATCQDDAMDEAEILYWTKNEFEVQAKKYKFLNIEDIRKGVENPDDNPGVKDAVDENQGINSPSHDKDRNFYVFNWWGPIKAPGGGDPVITRVILINSKIAFMQPDPYENGRSNYILYNYEDVPGSPYGEGIPRILRALQKELNEKRNLELNYVHRTISPMNLMKEGALVNPEQIKRWRPNGLVLIRTSAPLRDVVMQLLPGPLGAASMAAMSAQETEIDIQKRGSMPDYTRGFGAELPASQTATQFGSIMAAAMSQLKYKALMLAENAMKYISELILEHDQQYYKPQFEQFLFENDLLNAGKEELAMAAKEIVVEEFRINEESRMIARGDEEPQFMTITYWDLLGQFDYYPVIDTQGEFDRGEQDMLLRSIPALLSMNQMCLTLFGQSMNIPKYMEKIGKAFKIGGENLMVSAADLPGLQTALPSPEGGGSPEAGGELPPEVVQAQAGGQNMAMEAGVR